MPNFTRRAIKESFLKLLNQRPLNKITVKDIVEDCGINRNSFYYHFEDIPALVEDILIEQVATLTKTHPTLGSVEEGFDTIVGYLTENKRAVYNIYNSLSRDVCEQNLMEVCEYIVRTYLGALLEGRAISEEDKAVLLRYHKCACFGSIIDWLNSGMKNEVSDYFRSICRLRLGWLPDQPLE